MTSATEPASASGAGREATASCRAGSNRAPRSSRSGKPSRVSTSRAWARTASIPSMIAAGSEAECASARSRLSTTGSHCLATAALVSASARRTWTAHLLRSLSRSARARRRWSSSSAILAVSAVIASLSLPASARSAASTCLAPSGWAVPFPSCWLTGASLAGRELGIDHVVVPAAAAVSAAARGRAGLPPWRGRTRREQLLVDLPQLGGQAPDAVQRRVFLERLPGVGGQVLRPCLLVHRHRAAAFGQQVLDLVGRGVELVAGVGQLAQPPVLVPVLLGVGDHPLDLGLVQVGGFGDGDPLLGPGVLVPGRDVQDPVRVDVEGDLDLRYAPRRRADVLQPEPAQDAVVRGPFPLALQDHDVHRALVVLGRAEHLGPPGRDRGVAL